MFNSANATPQSKGFGYIKSKTFEFKAMKEESKSKKQRFKKKPAAQSSSLNSSTVSTQALLTTTPNETMIELGSMGNLVPEWVDIYEEAEEKLKQIRDLYKEIQKLIASKVKMQFGNSEDIDKQIEKKNSQATNLLHDCEMALSRVSRKAPDETQNQERIRDNVKRSLATQIQEVATLLRKQQKGLLDRMKDIKTTGESSELNIENSDQLYSEDLQEMIMAEDIAKERDEDLNKLIDNINKLNHLFKQMNDIVLEQGTIVDRIDYNIEKSADDTRLAKKELHKANEYMKSRCGDSCIKILILLNLLFSFLLFLKYKSSK